MTGNWHAIFRQILKKVRIARYKLRIVRYNAEYWGKKVKIVIHKLRILTFFLVNQSLHLTVMNLHLAILTFSPNSHFFLQL